MLKCQAGADRAAVPNCGGGWRILGSGRRKVLQRLSARERTEGATVSMCPTEHDKDQEHDKNICFF